MKSNQMAVLNYVPASYSTKTIKNTYYTRRFSKVDNDYIYTLKSVEVFDSFDQAYCDIAVMTSEGGTVSGASLVRLSDSTVLNRAIVWTRNGDSPTVLGK